MDLILRTIMNKLVAYLMIGLIIVSCNDSNATGDLDSHDQETTKELVSKFKQFPVARVNVESGEKIRWVLKTTKYSTCKFQKESSLDDLKGTRFVQNKKEVAMAKTLNAKFYRGKCNFIAYDNMKNGEKSYKEGEVVFEDDILLVVVGDRRNTTLEKRLIK